MHGAQNHFLSISFPLLIFRYYSTHHEKNAKTPYRQKQTPRRNRCFSHNECSIRIRPSADIEDERFDCNFIHILSFIFQPERRLHPDQKRIDILLIMV